MRQSRFKIPIVILKMKSDFRSEEFNQTDARPVEYLKFDGASK